VIRLSGANGSSPGIQDRGRAINKATEICIGAVCLINLNLRQAVIWDEAIEDYGQFKPKELDLSILAEA
jgi:hypothetical protein